MTRTTTNHRKLSERASVAQARSAQQITDTTTRPTTNKERVVDLVINKGITQQDAATLTGVTQGRISQIISDVKHDPDTILLRDNKADVFEGLQARLINLANDDLLKTMLSKRGMTDVAILEDKVRLIRGQQGDVNYNQVQAIAINLNLGDLLKQRNDTSDVVDIT